MAVNLSPVGGVAAQFFDNSGYPLTGGKLYSYLAGTSTPATTYTSSNGATAHSNPIVLDAAGRVPAGGEIWLTDGINYKFVLKTSTDTLIATYDNITGINSNSVAYTNQQEIITATANQTVFPLSISYQPATNSLSVFVDGVNQYGPGAQYSYVETDSTTVTFNSGLHVGAEVKFTTTQQQGAGAVDASQVSYAPPFIGSVVTNVEAKLAQYVSVKDFGATGDGVTNDTASIVAALTASRSVYFPAGTYLVTPFDVPANTYIRTDGMETVIKRSTASLDNQRTINIVGSNVEIESFKSIGNISTESGEQNHCVFINPTSTTGAISNVTLHDIDGQDVRGDIVYLGANSGYPLNNVQIGRVTGDNILRNGVSITGGNNIQIQSIRATNVGLFVLDIEPEPYNTPATNIRVGIVEGKSVGVVPASAAAYAAGIQFGEVTVEPTIYGTNSTPPYASGGEQVWGLALRNTKDIQIGSFSANNFKSFAIWAVSNPGELGVQDMDIGYIQASNCGASESVYNCYVWGNTIQRMRVGSAVFDASATANKALFKANPNLVLTNIKATLTTGCAVVSPATNLVLDNAEVTGGSFVGSITNGVVRNAQFNGEALAGYCSPMVFENVTATCSSYIFNSSNDEHLLKHCTLNGGYYFEGFYKRVYTSAFRFGANWLWVDGSGKLRIKSSTAPTSDTDGTVVGTQT